MEERIKRSVGELWQNTSTVWKDSVATQYHTSCITVVESLLDRFSLLNRDLEYKIGDTLRKIEKFENT